MTVYFARTDVGCRRKQNEDAYYCDPQNGLFVVADGVGGRAAGELASALTIETFQQTAPMIQEAILAYTMRPGLEIRNMVLEVLDETCQQASRRVYEEAEIQGHRGMTTTVVAVAVGGGAAFVAHVGDSRAYLIREAEARQVTEDHSMVNELVRTGQMTAEEARKSRYRNVITRAVGLHPTVQPDLFTVEVLPGDRFLLNSDGLTDVLPPELLGTLGASQALEEGVDALLEEALNRGAPDNVTLILLEPEASAQAEAALARARIMEKLFLFEDLPFHARLRVSRICDEQFFTPGLVIVEKDAPGKAMYVVVQGELEVLVNDEPVSRLQPGSHFGEVVLADQGPRSATVRATTFGSLISIDQDHLMDFCRKEPELGNQILWKLLRTLSGHLRDMNRRLEADRGADAP